MNPSIERRFFWWGVVCGAALSVLACNDSTPSACTPGDSKACVGAGGCSGGQVCLSDGTSYGPCDCAGAMDGGPTADGGSDGGPATDAGPDGGPDAGTDAGLPACNAIAQTGCKVGERCTWLVTGASTGQFTCLPEGTVPAGGACSTPDAGGAPTFDDCVHGSVCVGGICDALCTPSPDSCPTNYGCQIYSGYFDAPTYGACDPTCDPLRQIRNTDGAAACGSPNPAMPTLGCYGLGAGPFHCSKSLDLNATADIPVGNGGPVFLNSCAPGFLPLLHASTSDPTVICTALCDPGVTSGQHPQNYQGISPYTCPAAGAGGNHECHFWWFVEDLTSNPLDAFSNSLGFCMDYMRYEYDSDGDGSPDTVYPSCPTLSEIAYTFDPTLPDNVYWGCGPHP